MSLLRLSRTLLYSCRDSHQHRVKVQNDELQSPTLAQVSGVNTGHAVVNRNPGVVVVNWRGHDIYVQINGACAWQPSTDRVLHTTFIIISLRALSTLCIAKNQSDNLLYITLRFVLDTTTTSGVHFYVAFVGRWSLVSCQTRMSNYSFRSGFEDPASHGSIRSRHNNYSSSSRQCFSHQFVHTYREISRVSHCYTIVLKQQQHQRIRVSVELFNSSRPRTLEKLKVEHVADVD